MSSEQRITAQMVKDLRDKTGAPWMDCKLALTEAKGDLAGAEVVLRKRGLASAQKRAGRATLEGLVGSYIHAGGKIGVMIELNCESDFVARTDVFQQLSHDIAMHIAATDPRFLSKDEVTQEILAKEKDIYRTQALASGKPEKVVEKIIEGKMEKFYEEVCLLDQHFIKDPSQTVSQVIAAAIGKLGENITLRRFVRFKVGDTSNQPSAVSQ
ncbi:MAG: translation elongation factor Ts [Acidobacteria bacterium RIFCSPLOWO2_12_FULL_54_10]|nr:MAG: translation elongation factor Ts [Acidobacteria bacterium RIFCSPLOWO2_12_FULL_54_10]